MLFCMRLVWWLVFSVVGICPSRRLCGRWDEMRDIVKASPVGTLAIMLGAAICHIRMITVVFAAAFWAASAASTMLSRLVLRHVLKRVRLRGRNLRDMVVVGTNVRAVQFVKRIESTGESGYRVIGFVDEEWAGSEEFRNSGYKLICDFDGLRSFLRGNVVDEVVLALPMRSLHSHASEVAALCEEQGIVLRFTSNLFDLKLARPRAVDFARDSVSTPYTGGLTDGRSVLMNRELDCAVWLTLMAAGRP